MDIRGPVSQRIDMLRFLMIFGVVVVHTQIFMPLSEVSPLAYSQFLAFFQDAVFRCTVPLLSLISGYCLFNSGLDTQVAQLFIRKARTLLVPFLVFNLGLLAVDFIAYQFAGRSLSLNPPVMDRQDWFNAAFGLSAYPINFPLYFLRDLMVLIVLAPLFGWILRHAPLAGCIGVALFFLTDSDRSMILRNDMPVEFYLGGLLAVRKANILSMDKYAYPFLGIFLILCASVVFFDLPIAGFLRILSPFLIWPLGAVLARTGFGLWLVNQNRYSFFVFIAHAPVLIGLWTVNSYLRHPLPDQAFPVLAPFLAVAILVALHKFASKMIPGAFAIATGARGVPTARPERRLVPFVPGMWPAASERRSVARQ
jgi:succinoglycan biosynthesis protein ExoH